MYTGNGATKKFMLPEGKDGSEVYLKFPGGKKIKMKAGAGYEVSGGYVIFEAAILTGIEIFFEEDTESEELKKTGYVVIYGDGRIVEVNEDPVKYLEETQRLLKSSETYMKKMEDESNRMIKRMREQEEEISARIDEKLRGYNQQAERELKEIQQSLKSELRLEAEELLTGLISELRETREVLRELEEIRDDTREAAREAATKAAEETTGKIEAASEKILEAYEETKKQMEEIRDLKDEAKESSKQAYREAQILINMKVNEELEILKNLRMKLETDAETIKVRINNAWEVLRGELEEDE